MVFKTPLEFGVEDAEMTTNKEDQEKIKEHLLIIGNGLSDIYKLLENCSYLPQD